MASLTANSATVQILEETASLLGVRLLLHQNTAGDESSVLKVNVETLTSRTFALTLDTSQPNFILGETLVGATSNARAEIVDIRHTSNTVIVTDLTGNTAFSSSEVVTGTRSARSANTTAFTVPARTLEIIGAEWSCDGNTKIGVEFANSSAFSTALMLCGNGYMGSNQQPMKVGPPATLTAPNGNIYISTYSVPAKGGYTLLLRLRKSAGFARTSGY